MHRLTCNRIIIETSFTEVRMTIPTIMHLQQIFSTLSPQSQRIATYFITHVRDISQTSCPEIAASCATSKSAVVRLCKKLGFAGYKEFLTTLNTEIALEEQSTRFPSGIYADMDIPTVCSVVTNNSICGLEESLKILNLDNFRIAVEKLVGARQILAFGMGNSGFVAMDAETKFRRIGYTTFLATDIDRMLIGLASATKEDVAILLSNSGMTYGLQDACEIARQAGVTTIAITSIGDNTLSRNADIVLATANSEKLTRIGAMTSRIVMLNVVDMLFTAVASNTRKTAEAYIMKSMEYFKSLRKNQVQRGGSQ